MISQYVCGTCWTKIYGAGVVQVEDVEDGKIEVIGRNWVSMNQGDVILSVF